MKKNNKSSKSHMPALRADYCLKHNAENRYSFLMDQISSINERLSQLPDGKLLYHKVGDSYQLYQRLLSDDIKTGDRHYLNKKKIGIACELAEKAYLEALLKDYERESNALRKYIKNAYGINHTTELLSKSPIIAELMTSQIQLLSDDLLAWQNADYETNTAYEDGLLINGPGGVKLRSKSELVIAMALYNRGIPYRYESKLQLGETVFYPDFTIRHPHTGKEYIWEHFGMMSNPGYVRSAENKIHIYLMYGYIPSINFITTYETGDNALDLAYVETLINYYFGDV